ncbi:FtsW/RodA/SpoVE family cell cycle protein [Fusobacterium mortiferum]|jgi:cell division protein FtsW (lipid II flippase)|uniref:FtsW/RodA/SpoVE family cell cycle protein n=1 Tax=Fusobacterium mortiferum ATCC 9817 TaxID=469616 RepID=A0ABM6TYZ3_FUSMR|nr:FtsW/RodA/SpoVE family cell cycle protein [Fusobacterium mortiferum]AVQ19684.1 FtsW/RodA/SpoVE family cell cycle protein [Fusobacterium mortiferum ATCC 9817]EEO35892.1 putative stage V sporulation protein E [Fusobacterium mortiferum ATCC 9817]MCF2698366.1 FtsW/RodA/SpoVE family cell cycle protein [Fusobacterium mortiferum]MCI7188845.1 FtsW/RodA/SpoVE family cell cycle protein [Fusobacterium mortiferum]MDY2801817.1 FtsW/RodA/SpoVE family cell cycle protein [Fusobacterium mortiferum]
MDKVKLETENPYYKRNQINRTLKKIDKEKRKRARNRGIVLLLFFLVILSNLNMASASFYSIYFEGIKVIRNHFIYIILGIICFIITSKINYKLYNKNKISGILFLLSTIIFIIIIIGSKIPSLSRVIPHVNGAIGWIRFGSFSVQPSEMMKLPFIIIIAHIMEKCEEERYNDKKILFSLLPVMGIFMLLINLQKDLGTSIHYLGIFAFMLFMSRLNMKLIVGSVGAVLVSIGGLFYYVSNLTDLSNESYKIKRVGSFLNGLLKNEYDYGIGYQVGQSLIAFGSGGLVGKGYGNGVQKYSYLPEIKTDFILASYGEEFGFIGMLLLLTIFLLLFNIIQKTAVETKDYFGKYLAIGIGGYIIIQMVINLSVALGILPVFGIPMPFFSSGGSSLITVFSALGIIININKQR